jgi:putative transport protein
MQWPSDLPESQPVIWAVLVLMLVAIAGLVIASVKIKGIGLGVTGVLFAGILAGHFGWHIEKTVLDFVREFGLILFVFTIGLQLGPGFFALLRKQGLKLNLIAASVVVLGAILTVAIAWLGINSLAALGLFSGATTNTPSLGATQQMLKSLGGQFADNASLPALAYAVAYPGGVLGIIGSLLFFRFAFRFDPEKEADRFQAGQKDLQRLTRMNLVIENPRLENVPIAKIPDLEGVVVSRIKKREAGEVETATEETRLHQGDLILAVGTRPALEKFRDVVGRESSVNLLQTPGRILSERMVVTRKEVFGKTLNELALDSFYGVVITRIARVEVEMTAVGDLQLQFGDTLQVVGDENALAKVAEVLGNRAQALRETNFLPIFIGIALGVIIGTVQVSVPHIPVPVSLGLAGGPLILAILLSRVGRIGPLIWYMPASANAAFRELGIILFLACVGLKAGGKFFETVWSSQGLHWLLAGLVITIVPLLLAGFAARFVFKLDFTTISGLLAGSMTDPPALAFAHAVCKSDAPLVAYATVYPLAMLLRILAAQILALIFCG